MTHKNVFVVKTINYFLKNLEHDVLLILYKKTDQEHKCFLSDIYSWSTTNSLGWMMLPLYCSIWSKNVCVLFQWRQSHIKGHVVVKVPSWYLDLPRSSLTYVEVVNNIDVHSNTFRETLVDNIYWCESVGSTSFPSFWIPLLQMTVSQRKQNVLIFHGK